LIEEDGEDSLYVPAPSESTAKEEAFVIEHWCRDVERR